MSRFVSGGTVDEPVQRDDAWLKAQQEIEARRKEKADQNRQDGGKSLYETLQANKAAKQDAFEESTRLRNQFRALDEDEVEFLQSVNESTRAQEAAVKKATAEQLSQFRQQQEESEKAARASEVEVPTQENETWTFSKKRKREKTGQSLLGVKLRKSSSTSERPDLQQVTPVEVKSQGSTSPPKTTDVAAKIVKSSSQNDTAKPQPVKPPSPPVTTGLGLGDYSSDDE